MKVSSGWLGRKIADRITNSGMGLARPRVRSMCGRRGPSDVADSRSHHETSAPALRNAIVGSIEHTVMNLVVLKCFVRATDPKERRELTRLQEFRHVLDYEGLGANLPHDA